MLKKLWLGEYSLLKTYWLFYVLFWNVSLLPLALWRQTSQSIQDSYPLLGLLLAIIFINYGCVVLVGLWRSASKYEGWWLWASLVKVIVLLGVVIVAVSIFGALQANLMLGVALLLASVVILMVMKCYEIGGYTKNIKIVVSVCLFLLALLMVGLGFNLNPMSFNNKANWIPLVKVVSLNRLDDGVSEGMAYLDLNSISSKNGLKYADEASEIYQDRKFTRTVKLSYEFDCSNPKARILKQTTYSKPISEGLGNKVDENLNYQATEAKRITDNGGIYTGGWDNLNEIEQDLSKYCGAVVDTREPINKFLCSARKRDVALIKSVCDAKQDKNYGK